VDIQHSCFQLLIESSLLKGDWKLAHEEFYSTDIAID
jgi:hypothetical protein